MTSQIAGSFAQYEMGRREHREAVRLDSQIGGPCPRAFS